MNTLLFHAGERSGEGRVTVDGARARHLLRIDRESPGRAFSAGEVNGPLGQGRDIRAHDSRVSFFFEALGSSPAKRPLSVVLALPRPKMLRRMLRTLAECGVRDIHLIHSERVEKSYWQSGLLETDTLTGYLLAGLEQAGDSVLPSIHLQRRFRPFAEDILPALARERDALLAMPGGPTPCPGGCAGETLLMLGPEGGYSAFEVTLITRAGLKPVHLGTRTLRAETALTAMLGRFLLDPFSPEQAR